MKIKCLFLDHDDTVVDSTKNIHYPAFCEVLEKLRPQEPMINYHDFVHHCHTLGFMHLCKERYQFNDTEMDFEYRVWKSYTQTRIPVAFDGIKDILINFKKMGGLIIVISHSEAPEIKRDYLTNFGFEPDEIYGWERIEAERKPHPFPILDSLKKYHLQAYECLMVDDMSLGQQMALKTQVPFAWAAWTHQENGIQKNASDLSFEDLNAFASYLELTN